MIAFLIHDRLRISLEDGAEQRGPFDLMIGGHLIS